MSFAWIIQEETILYNVGPTLGLLFHVLITKNVEHNMCIYIKILQLLFIQKFTNTKSTS